MYHKMYVMLKQIKSYLLDLIIVVCVVIIVCIVAEVVLRLIAPYRWSLFMEPTRVQVVNEIGVNFFNVEFTDGGIYWEPYIPVLKGDEKHKDFLADYSTRFFPKALLRRQTRIVLLGDSTGYVNEKGNKGEMFSSLLEKHLNAARLDNLGYVVANIGSGSYGTFQKAIAFKRRGVAFSPHLVILEFGTNENEYSNFVYSKRDPRRPAHKGAYILTINRNVIPLSLPLSRKVNQFFCRHSLLFRFLSLQVDRVENTVGMQRHKTDEYDMTGEQAQNALKSINKLARANGSNLLVVTFPSVDKPIAKQSNKKYPHSEMLRFANKEGIPIFDLIADMPDVEFGKVRLNREGRTNKMDYRAMAEKLSAYLKAHPELFNSKPKPLK